MLLLELAEQADGQVKAGHHADDAAADEDGGGHCWRDPESRGQVRCR